MQLNIDSFSKNTSIKTKKNQAIASNLSLKGLENIPELEDLLKEIFSNYEFENGVLKLIDEICQNCKNKLIRKGTYVKEINLPGGITLPLIFHQYSCNNCKIKVDRKLDSWFEKGERYSKNVKSDAIRLYLNNLSSYEIVKDELVKIYRIPNLSKKTVRTWIKNKNIDAKNHLESETDFSGHFIYDEEYIKVFDGDVGVKNAKLTRVEIYLLLFRDAITKKTVLMLSDSLDKNKLYLKWQEFTKWVIKKNIPFKTLTTDGKREYNIMVKELNFEFELKIKHSYCLFHFKKNLFEVSNKFEFGCIYTKKELPKYIINQIKSIEEIIDSKSIEIFNKKLKTDILLIKTYIDPLRKQIQRLNTYKYNYMLHLEHPFLKTTNLCEQWFSRVKPSKVKKGYKTRIGFMSVIRNFAVKISNSDWKNKLGIPKDIKDATDLLITSLLYKC